MERMRQVIAGDRDGPPVARTIGFRLIEIDQGRAVFELEARRDRHANPMGTLHGGILCDVADAAMGTAYATLLGPDESFTTLELKINFLRPIWNGKLRAKGRIVSKGKTVALLACDIFDEKDRHVPAVSSTVLLLSGEMAKGR